MGFVDVGPVADFKERSVRLVGIAGGLVGVVRWSGRFFAVRNICPHQAAPLCEGRVTALMVERSDVILADDSVPVLTCPWHGWEFDLATGRAIGDPTLRVRTYPARVEGTRLLVDVESSPQGVVSSARHRGRV